MSVYLLNNGIRSKLLDIIYSDAPDSTLARYPASSICLDIPLQKITVIIKNIIESILLVAHCRTIVLNLCSIKKSCRLSMVCMQFLWYQKYSSVGNHGHKHHLHVFNCTFRMRCPISSPKTTLKSYT